MGFFKVRAPLLMPGFRASLVGSATSVGKTLGPRGVWAMQSSSTTATTPDVMYLAPGKPGDELIVACTLCSSSAGGVLRTSSSGVYMGSSASAWDSVQFFYPASVRLVALTTTLWGVVGATTTASGSLPLLVTSTS